MDNEPLDNLHEQLVAMRMPGAPAGLRESVLHGVHRELRAARWDRRLAWAAVVLLVIGIGMNGVMGLRPNRSSGLRLADGPTQESLLQVAMTVAEATDVQTGRRFAQQWAALAGRTLTGDELAAIDAAVGCRVIGATNGGDG